MTTTRNNSCIVGNTEAIQKCGLGKFGLTPWEGW